MGKKSKLKSYKESKYLYGNEREEYEVLRRVNNIQRERAKLESLKKELKNRRREETPGYSSIKNIKKKVDKFLRQRTLNRQIVKKGGRATVIIDRPVEFSEAKRMFFKS